MERKRKEAGWEVLWQRSRSISTTTTCPFGSSSGSLPFADKCLLPCHSREVHLCGRMSWAWCICQPAKVFACVCPGVAEVLRTVDLGDRRRWDERRCSCLCPSLCYCSCPHETACSLEFLQLWRGKERSRTVCAAACERCGKRCLQSVRKSLKWPAAAPSPKLFSCPPQGGIFLLPVGCHGDASALHPSRLLKLGNDR